MPKGIVAVLAGLLLAQPVGPQDLVKVATIPQGHINYNQLPVGDLDHDGRRELLFEQSRDPFSANIWEHWGDDSFEPVKIVQGCVPVAVGDPDEDGLSDVLCQWGPRAFLLESTSPTRFPTRTVWEEPLGGFPGIRGYFEDTDGDGRQEMWIVPNDPDWIEVWENRGDNAYERVAVLTYPTMNPATLAFGDFDTDGRTDVVVGTTEGLLFVWETTGNDSWALAWTDQEPVDVDVSIVAAARDLDGDGKPEFLVGLKFRDFYYDHGVAVFEATGDDAYARVWSVRGDGSFSPTRVVVGDVDADGVEEFAVAIPGAIQLYRAAGDDDYAVVEEVPYTSQTVEGGRAIALADLNGNGADELVFNGAFDEDLVAERIFIDELASLQPPVVVSAFFPLAYGVRSGRALPVHAKVHNRTEQTHTVDVWAKTYRGTGQGGPQGPLLSRELLVSRVPLPPGTSAGHDRDLALPTQPGPYTIQLEVGTFPDQVVDTRWFTVLVRPAAPATPAGASQAA